MRVILPQRDSKPAKNYNKCNGSIGTRLVVGKTVRYGVDCKRSSPKLSYRLHSNNYSDTCPPRLMQLVLPVYLMRCVDEL